MASNKSNKNTSKKSTSTQKKTPTPNYQKKAVKTVKKAAKKNPKAFIIILLVAVLVVGIGLAVYFLFLKDKLGPKGDSSSEPTSSEVVSSEVVSSEVVSSEQSSEEESSHDHEHSYDPIITSGMSINFIEFENYHTGDSTYIKVGENIDILIDAGSTQASADTIKKFVNKYCTDNTLEYVIATHAHQDHIAGFVGTTKYAGVFESYHIGTLIDFAGTNQDPSKGLYKSYLDKRAARIASGEIEHHYTAAECIAETGGAKKEYTLAEGITMTILDQRYYTETTGDENNYSVCALFTQGDNHYLFTGDLEKEGEESLVAKNPSLPKCQLFKGGHHGSKTSNTDTLLSVIQPEVVCICCCAGNDEYTSNVDNQFPTQTAINNISKYTKYIYVTSVTTDGHTGFTSMNGNINFKCEDGINYVVSGSNNSVILKETEWFASNRTWPAGGK